MTKEERIAGLTSKQDADACALADRIISESRETDVWYHATDDRKGYFENGSAYETSAERRGVKKSQNAGG